MRKGTTVLITAVITIILFILLLLYICSTMLYDLRRFDASCLETDKGNIYISVQHESNPLGLEDTVATLDGFKHIYFDLQRLPFEYYEIYQQFLDCSTADGTFFNAASGNYSTNCNQAFCVQISENAQADFNFSVRSGRAFSNDDYIHITGNKIPVIMGANYATIYEIGDCFRAYYLFSPFVFEIIGFLDSDCNISTSRLFIPLDDCIIMPSFDFAEFPQTRFDYITQKIHYANKTSGKFKVPATQFENANTALQNIISKSSVGDYSLSYSSFEKAMYARGINIRLVFSISCSSIPIAIAVALLSAGLTTRRNKMKFSQLQKLTISSICTCVASSFAYLLAQYICGLLGLYYRITASFALLVVSIWIALIAVLPRNTTQGNAGSVLRDGRKL